MDVALQFEGHGKIALLGKLENALFGVRCAPDFTNPGMCGLLKTYT